ncbi:hypothetical protein PAXRUDRAFT_30862 [Paxillus rubicundulus Ve08.2h10]|uniref:Uncharacterized protein n=1 Tax=Paxillus rubicundulus Ve08.2h10 TaxID=930991 RepID=A0A0D0DVJ4_9AGAM|nr:hypothetical protein PAXRUDRAFT_30862 [Paxillus rubicundulus Ve08.2h10]
MSSSILTGPIQLDASGVESHYEDSGTAALNGPATHTTPGLWYPPTTAWEETDPNPLDKDQQEEYRMKQEVLELAGFLPKFATSQVMPKVNEEQKTRGTIVLGWSLGASYLHSLLAYLVVLPADQLKDSESYLYAMVSHGTSPTPNFQSCNLDDLEYATPTSNLGASLDGLLRQEYGGMTSLGMFIGPDLFRLLIGRELLNTLPRRALFDAILAQELPRVRLHYICGGQMVGILIHTMHRLEGAVNGDPFQLFGEGTTFYFLLHYGTCIWIKGTTAPSIPIHS